MSFNGGEDSWKPEGGGDETWKPEEGFTAHTGENWAGDGAGNGFGGDDAGLGGEPGGGDNGAPKTCRICNQAGHIARECPDKPANSGQCYNCGETGHNKADCPNPRVERPFEGKCNSCGTEGHSARNCPTLVCRLCRGQGHKAVECTARRFVDWTGVPELSDEEAWNKLIAAAKDKDLDVFRTCLRAYARAVPDGFNLADIERCLREDQLDVYLIAKQQDIALNMTIVDLIGNADQEFILTIQLSDKPRRAKQAQGWPENAEQNLERLAKAGFVQDKGVPLCSRCNELGHVAKHCKVEQEPRESTQPEIRCVYCQEIGHRARDCTQERKPRGGMACRNCGQEGHKASECTEPRSAANVECRKCNKMGHFSKDCPNVESKPRSCRNCGSEDHMMRECPEPRNPATVTCRNCETLGHFSRDCPEPKDWSKVQCQNCQQFGHTAKKCKEPIPDDGEDGGVGFGGPVEANGGWGGDVAAETTGATGGWDSAPAGGGDNSESQAQASTAW